MMCYEDVVCECNLGSFFLGFITIKAFKLVNDVVCVLIYVLCEMAACEHVARPTKRLKWVGLIRYVFVFLCPFLVRFCPTRPNKL